MKTIYKTLIVTLVIVATMSLSVLLWNYIQEQGAKHRAEFLAEMAKRKAITKCVEERYNCKFIGGGV